MLMQWWLANIPVLSSAFFLLRNGWDLVVFSLKRGDLCAGPIDCVRLGTQRLDLVFEPVSSHLIPRRAT